MRLTERTRKCKGSCDIGCPVAKPLPLSSSIDSMSGEDCLEDKREYYQNYYVLCLQQLCIVIRTHRGWAKKRGHLVFLNSLVKN